MARENRTNGDTTVGKEQIELEVRSLDDEQEAHSLKGGLPRSRVLQAAGQPSKEGGPSQVVRCILMGYFIFIASASVLIAKASGDVKYNVALCVLLTECTKWAAASIIDNVSGGGGTTSWTSWLRYGGPALLYAALNNLAIYSTIIIGPPLYSLLINSKILFAALLGRSLLSQKLTSVQWAGLVNLVLACIACRLFKVFAADACVEIVGGTKAVAAGGAKPRGLGAGAEQAAMLGMGGGEGEHQSSAVEVMRQLGTAPGGSFFPAWETSAEYGALSGAFGALVSAELSEDGMIPDNGFLRRLTVATDVSQGFIFLVGIGLVFFCGLLSGASGAVNEFLIKGTDAEVTLMRKNAYTYQWGALFNLISAVFLFWNNVSSQALSGSAAPAAAELQQSSLGFLEGVTEWQFWAQICINSSLGLTVSLVLKHFDNVIKCIGRALQLQVFFQNFLLLR